MSNSKIYLGANNLGSGKIKLGANDVSAIYLGAIKVYGDTTPPIDYLCFTANTANCTVGMTNNGSNQPVMYYSTDQTNWTLWDYSNITLANVDDKVYFYGDNPNGFSTSDSKYSTFTMSGSISASGDVTTLITQNGTTTLPSDYCFQRLFYNCRALTSAPDIPATTLTDNCYLFMFLYCSSLVTAPVLPAMTTAYNCYAGMFAGCSSLVTAPELPATNLGGNKAYDSMFDGCTSLVNGPSVLPMTTIGDNMYQYMFRDCSNMVNAPVIMAENVTTNCFTYMFYNCRKIAKIEVHSTSWNTSYASNWVRGVSSTGTFYKKSNVSIPTGNNGIPTGWTVVDVNMLRFTAQEANSTIGYTSTLSTPPTIYKSTDGVNFTSWDGTPVTLSNIGDTLWVYGTNQTLAVETYVEPFREWTNFVMTGSIAADGDVTYLLQDGGLSTLTVAHCLSSLFYNCTSLTKAPELPSTTLADKCYDFMFYGCTGLTEAPTLPATTLANGCYSYMFSDCTNLTTAPALPVTTLVQSCYNGMFNGCSSLNSVTCLATDISATSCTHNWLTDVAATGTFTKNSSMSSWTTGSDGIPTGWTVVDAQ